RFLDCLLGSRDAKTGKKLWESLENLAHGVVWTDYWQSYEVFVPIEQHGQSKAETFTVEGYNSLFRHFLARMRRKSKCYSKCRKMLDLSIRLFMHHWNEKTIIN